MQRLLYYDGHIAISDESMSDESEWRKEEEQALRLLLSIDENRLDEEKHLKPLLPFFGTSEGFGFSSEHIQVSSGNVNADALQQLGYAIEDGCIRVLDNGNLLTRRLSDVSKSRERILDYAGYLQYLAKLYLLSEGEKRHSGLLPDMVFDLLSKHKSISATIKIPKEFRYSLEIARLDTPVTFDIANAEETEDANNISIPVTIDRDRLYVSINYFDKISAYYDAYIDFTTKYDDDPSVEEPPAPRLDGFESKRLVASGLLVSLICYQTSLPYTLSWEEHPRLILNQSDTWASTLANYMIGGKIRACPNCGRPVLCPKKSSMPYCTKSCSTLYNRKAQKMLKGGAFVDEVAEAFPHINRKTIENWSRPEGW